MVLADYLNALRRGRFVILLAVVLGVLASSIATLRAPLQFNSDSAVLISAVGSGSPQDRQAGDSFASARAVTYAALATTQQVLQPAARQLQGISWQELRSRVTAVVREGTSVIALRAVDTTSAAAAAEADAVTNTLVDQVQSIEAAPPKTNAVGGGRFDVRVIDRPQPAKVALFPQPRNNLLAGVAAGLVVGVIVALIRGSLVTVVTDERTLPRRGFNFDLTAGTGRSGRLAGRRRRAELLTAGLERRLGPAWTVVVVAASRASNPSRTGDAIARAALIDGATLVVRLGERESRPRATSSSGVAPQRTRKAPSSLDVRAGDLSSVVDEWDSLTVTYRHVIVACAFGTPSRDLAKLLSLTKLAVIATARNSTRVTELRSTTQDLESLGAKQILTLLDDR